MYEFNLQFTIGEKKPANAGLIPNFNFKLVPTAGLELATY